MRDRSPTVGVSIVAQRTIENSPALQRWVTSSTKSRSPRSGRQALQPSVSRTPIIVSCCASLNISTFRQIFLSSRDSSQLVKHLFIDVAPAPVFAGLERFDDWVIGGLKVFGRVLVLRRVAAADVAAGHAEPQVDPGVADLQAVFAAIRARGDFFDLF
jgi:hypothetical protein